MTSPVGTCVPQQQHRAPPFPSLLLIVIDDERCDVPIPPFLGNAPEDLHPPVATLVTPLVAARQLSDHKW